MSKIVSFLMTVAAATETVAQLLPTPTASVSPTHVPYVPDDNEGINYPVAIGAGLGAIAAVISIMFGYACYKHGCPRVVKTYDSDGNKIKLYVFERKNPINEAKDEAPQPVYIDNPPPHQAESIYIVNSPRPGEPLYIINPPHHGVPLYLGHAYHHDGAHG